MTGSAPRIAMVLAAGRGRRMRPLSDALPKPALPLPDGPVVAWPLRLAAHAGARRIVVNAWHLPDIMANALAEARIPGAEVVMSREDELMGTAGGLTVARDRGLLGGDGPVLVFNADGVLDLDLEPLFQRHGQRRNRVTLGLLPHLDPNRWSRVMLDPDGTVTAILAPGASASDRTPLLYPGVMVVSRDALTDLPVGPGGVAELLWQPACASGRLGGVVLSGSWREVGTPRGYLEVVLDHLNGRRLVDPTATVEDSARLGCAMIGRNARVAAGAVVEDAVVAAGAEVGPEARVLRSVVLGPVTVGAHESVVDEMRAAPPKSG